MSEALPDHWGTTSIEKSAYLRGRIGWQGLRADEFIEDGPYLVTGTDFKDGKIDWSTCYHVTEARYREAAPIQLRDDDLLVTKDGTIGKVAYVSDCPDQAVLNSGVFLLRCSNGSFRHRWLYHLLTSSHFEKFLRQNLAGSTINHLYQYVFEKYQFPVPQSDEEQKKLCNIIDLIDTQIEATEALIAKQERLRAGLMQDLFTRGVDENGELRPPREKAPHLFHETEIGWLPKGWEPAPLARLVDPTRPISYGILMPGPHVPDGVPVIKVKDIRGGRILEMGLRRTSKLIDAEYARSRLRTGDILFTIRGTVGRIAPVPESLAGANITQDTARLAVTGCDPSFARYFLESETATRYVAANTLGNAVQGINLGELKKLLVPNFDPAEQRELVNCILRHGALNDELNSELSSLKLLKSGLMQDLLIGTVSVEPLLEKEPA